MSGHSKWHSIKHQKGAADAKRGALFTKLANAITLAAREGGGDTDTNFKLRLAMEKAKQANMPKDNIERAIKRGTGEGEGTQLEEVVYEGFLVGGGTVLVEALTDNRNRTVADIKHALAKNGGSLGGPHSISWQYERKGVVRVAIPQEHIADKDAFSLKALEWGVEDVREEYGGLLLITAVVNLHEAHQHLERAGIAVESAELSYLAKEEVKLTGDNREKCEKILEALDDIADVQELYTNVKIS
ncbi:MAG: YebC/PmpR family DNA-binding transcriptional regulator [Parcubacteria group bacterium CG08_land_8_20_14_0_20_48_21]|nr:MAG: hypothetical protein AUK21_01700 [Parcubacteria group bacterium CG2_30_48_51]PIS33117.1 MAG: YebC/PmpR family DNA-binding transcriptional regulator [Parcubacteria group bacterium CG08_land_8_20_14_0_20_48_21]PIW79257.1 MAG: YebC/PmpR family DNA-binding transcriptional regulator [Parcubacteria group bacterium CG_4_8_14_3_um_filter_48_16]PIY78321.1 MAG: YebC/PmpR family DNA-binding transcriptional regulator [Parcubacteria group bacterium CG_4_10_14_0_8_um_filter_48_154]PIZ77682.1 MAG: Yeb